MEATDLPVSQRLIDKALSTPSTRKDDLIAKVGKEPDETAFYLITGLCEVICSRADDADQAQTELTSVASNASDKAIQKVVMASSVPALQVMAKRYPSKLEYWTVASMVAYFELQRRYKLINKWEIFEDDNGKYQVRGIES